MTRQLAERPEFDSRQGQIFFSATASRRALGPTQPPIQWVLGAVSLGVKIAGAKMTILRMRGAMLLLPNTGA
jgi:hypothetical protein